MQYAKKILGWFDGALSSSFTLYLVIALGLFTNAGVHARLSPQSWDLIIANTLAELPVLFLLAHVISYAVWAMEGERSLRIANKNGDELSLFEMPLLVLLGAAKRIGREEAEEEAKKVSNI